MSLSNATFTDANPGNNSGDFSGTINWGDGHTTTFTSADVSYSSGVYTVNGSHTYAEEGSYTTTVTVNDAGSSSATITGSATIVDAALIGSSAASASGNEGASVSLSNATFTDANPGNNSGDFSGTINWGDGHTTTFTSADVSYSSGVYTVNGSHTYAEEGSYTTTVTVNDAGSSSATITGSATIVDAALIGSSAASASGNEGASVSLSNATFTDANPGNNSGDFSGTINWGDGHTTTFTSADVSYSSGVYTVNGSHTYAEEGSYTTTVTVNDAGSSSATITGSATIVDAALIGSSAASASGNEGASVSLSNATFTDANPGNNSGDFSGTINWGDGHTTTFTSADVSYSSGVYTVNGSHTYAEEGSYTTTVTVNDAGSSSATITGSATIVDAALIGSSAASASGNEGASVSLSNATFTDANPGNNSGDFSGTINWGDGHTTTFTSADVSYSSGVYTVNGSHTYAEEGSYTTTVTVNDAGSSSATITGSATIVDAALIGSSAASASGNEGASVSLSNATFTDANPGNNSGDFSGTINWGDGHTTTFTSADVSYSSGVYTVNGSHTYAEEGSYTTTVTVNDAGSSSATITGSATIVDAALIGSSAASASGNEGASVSLSNATFTDANPGNNSGDFSGTINWGDGHTTTFTSADVSYSSGVYTVNGSHTYAEEGSYTTTVTVNDAGSSSATITGSATIVDAALIGSSAASASGNEGASVSLSNATFTDANPGNNSGDFSGTINWGDGHTTTFTSADVSYSSGVYTVNGSHTYAEEGSYTTTVTVNDAGSSSATITGSATIVPVAEQPTAAAPATLSMNENASNVAVTDGTNFVTVGPLKEDGDDTVSVVLAVTHGTLNIATLAGVTESAQSGASLTLSGDAALVNSVLHGLSYTPGSEYEGSDTLNVTVTSIDGSNTYPTTTSASTTITVNPIAAAPTAAAPATLAVNENASNVAVTDGTNFVTVGPLKEDGDDTVSVVLAVTHGTLNIATLAGVTESAQSGASLTLSGDAALVNSVLHGLSYTPGSEYEGSDTLNVTVTSIDGSNTYPTTTSASTTITVNPIAAAPTAAAPATLAVNENASNVAVTDGTNFVTVGPLKEDGDDTVSVVLAVTHGTLNIATLAGVTESAQSGSSLTLSGDAALVNSVLHGLSYTPTAQYVGSDTLNVTTTSIDGSNTYPTTTSASTAIAVNNETVTATNATVATPENVQKTGTVTASGDTDSDVSFTAVTEFDDAGRLGHDFRQRQFHLHAGERLFRHRHL